ncbi:hypothetical protein [Dulcicalothrix desertica]|uniref:hypothetical protein n=1 Tax=Dulcicalothrix desertica TaxID=32056 RepID=UPI001C99EB19|nr:hypothetical protein [Dulcicalothrix desertica]
MSARFQFSCWLITKLVFRKWSALNYSFGRGALNTHQSTSSKRTFFPITLAARSIVSSVTAGLSGSNRRSRDDLLVCICCAISVLLKFFLAVASWRHYNPRYLKSQNKLSFPIDKWNIRMGIQNLLGDVTCNVSTCIA